MKTYILIQDSYHETSIIRCYASREEAFKDADLIASHERVRVLGDDTFHERWIKIGDVWYNQCQHTFEREEVQWRDPVEHHSGRLYVCEYDMLEMPFYEKFNAIQHWQQSKNIHPLTCGFDPYHPILVPRFSCLNQHVELICPFEDSEGDRCAWVQAPDHPVFNIIYAKYISDRTSAT